MKEENLKALLKEALVVVQSCASSPILRPTDRAQAKTLDDLVIRIEAATRDKTMASFLQAIEKKGC